MDKQDIIINNIIINQPFIETKVITRNPSSPQSPEWPETPFKNKIEFKISIEKWLLNKGFDT